MNVFSLCPIYSYYAVSYIKIFYIILRPDLVLVWNFFLELMI